MLKGCRASLWVCIGFRLSVFSGLCALPSIPVCVLLVRSLFAVMLGGLTGCNKLVCSKVFAITVTV